MKGIVSSRAAVLDAKTWGERGSNNLAARSTRAQYGDLTDGRRMSVAEPGEVCTLSLAKTKWICFIK